MFDQQNKIRAMFDRGEIDLDTARQLLLDDLMPDVKRAVKSIFKSESADRVIQAIKEDKRLTL